MLDMPTLRRRVDEVLRTDEDLTAFCLDYYPEVQRRFTGQMEVNLLLTLAPERDELAQQLARYSNAICSQSGPLQEPTTDSAAPPSWRDPFAVLKAAIAALPVLKYALGVVGLAAVITIVTRGFGLDAGTATIGALIVLGLMTVLIVLAVAARQSRRLVLPALVLTWTVMGLLLSSSTLLIASFFFSWPKASSCLFKVEGCEPARGLSRALVADPPVAVGTPAAPPATSSVAIREWRIAGIVRDARHTPLAGITVSLPQLAATAQTDAHGVFRLAVSTERSGLVLLRAEKAPTAPGGKRLYRPQEVHVYLGSTELDIVLERN
jgi:hypothetical protein